MHQRHFLTLDPKKVYTKNPDFRGPLTKKNTTNRSRGKFSAAGGGATALYKESATLGNGPGVQSPGHVHRRGPGEPWWARQQGWWTPDTLDGRSSFRCLAIVCPSLAFDTRLNGSYVLNLELPGAHHCCTSQDRKRWIHMMHHQQSQACAVLLVQNCVDVRKPGCCASRGTWVLGPSDLPWDQMFATLKTARQFLKPRFDGTTQAIFSGHLFWLTLCFELQRFLGRMVCGFTKLWMYTHTHTCWIDWLVVPNHWQFSWTAELYK